MGRVNTKYMKFAPDVGQLQKAAVAEKIPRRRCNPECSGAPSGRKSFTTSLHRPPLLELSHVRANFMYFVLTASITVYTSSRSRSRCRCADGVPCPGRRRSPPWHSHSSRRQCSPVLLEIVPFAFDPARRQNANVPPYFLMIFARRTASATPSFRAAGSSRFHPNVAGGQRQIVLLDQPGERTLGVPVGEILRNVSIPRIRGSRCPSRPLRASDCRRRWGRSPR